jgi:DNA-binding PadR family transcriptional regulator
LQAAGAEPARSLSLARNAHVTRARAGAVLRTLERAGLLRAELIGGGELGYELTAPGRMELAAVRTSAPLRGREPQRLAHCRQEW